MLRPSVSKGDSRRVVNTPALGNIAETRKLFMPRVWKGALHFWNVSLLRQAKKSRCFAFLLVFFIAAPQYFRFLTERREKIKRIALFETITGENQFFDFLEEKCDWVWAKRLTLDLCKYDCFNK